MSKSVTVVLVGNKSSDGELLFSLREPSGGTGVICEEKPDFQDSSWRQIKTERLLTRQDEHGRESDTDCSKSLDHEQLSDLGRNPEGQRSLVEGGGGRL